MGTNRSGRAHIDRLKRQRRDTKRIAAKHAAAEPRPVVELKPVVKPKPAPAK